MKLENQVVSLELAKKLKELGVKQDGYFCYVVSRIYPDKMHIDDTKTALAIIELSENDKEFKPDLYSAFTVAELGEMLPKEVFIPYKGNSGKKRKYPQHLHCFFSDYAGWYINYTGGNTQDTLGERDKNEANCRAKMLIYLIENKLY